MQNRRAVNGSYPTNTTVAAVSFVSLCVDGAKEVGTMYRAIKETSMNPRTPILLAETDTAFSIDLQEQVRRRAFEIYEQRGRKDGRDVEDWLQAEAEVLSQR